VRRHLSALVVVIALSTMAIAMIRGDGPGSGGILFELSSTHGVNKNDVPVFVAWLVGLIGTAWLWWETGDREE
jgi:hypothetical protein